MDSGVWDVFWTVLSIYIVYMTATPISAQCKTRLANAQRLVLVGDLEGNCGLSRVFPRSFSVFGSFQAVNPMLINTNIYFSSRQILAKCLSEGQIQWERVHVSHHVTWSRQYHPHFAPRESSRRDLGTFQWIASSFKILNILHSTSPTILNAYARWLGQSQ